MLKISSETPLKSVGVYIEEGTSWADKFNDGQRIVDLHICAHLPGEECSDACQDVGTGKVLGCWTGEARLLPVNLLSLNGHPNPSLSDVYDAVLRTMMIDPDHRALTPATLATAIIYERTT